MTDDHKRNTGGDHSQCGFSTGICGAITAGTGALDDCGYWEHPCGECALKANLHEADRALAESRAEVAEVREAWDCSRDATLKYRARAERLHAAGMRVTAAFRALGDASNFTAEAHAKHECEEAMIALDAALNLEPTP